MVAMGRAYDTPSKSRRAYDCFKPAMNAIEKLRSAKSPLIGSYGVAIGIGPEIHMHAANFEQMQKWDASWDITARLLELADVKSLAELSHVQGDSSDGDVAGTAGLSGGHYMPTEMTETNEYGETVLKTAGVRAQCLTCSKTFKYRGDLRGEVAMCKTVGVGVRCHECQSWGCEVVEDVEPAGADEES